MNFVEGMSLPPITAETEPYWTGCQQGELRLQHCSQCERYQFYPRLLCTDCGATEYLSWRAVSGFGQLASYSTVHLPVAPVYADQVPYFVALVRLDEGPMMMSNLVHVTPDQIRSGMQLQVVFRRATDEVTLPYFEPVS